MFRSTWYCLTVMTPTRRTKRTRGGGASPGPAPRTQSATTATFTDMRMEPKATLRLVLVNEAELRKIVDGKLKPPNWGFFNERHESRFRLLMDFASNFREQLTRTPAVEPKTAKLDPRNPFTSERVHHKQ